MSNHGFFRCAWRPFWIFAPCGFRSSFLKVYPVYFHSHMTLVHECKVKHSASFIVYGVLYDRAWSMWSEYMLATHQFTFTTRFGRHFPVDNSEGGEMNQMRLPSRNSIRNSSPGRAPVPRYHRGFPQYWIFMGQKHYVSSKPGYRSLNHQDPVCLFCLFVCHFNSTWSTVLQPFQRFELDVHIAISVLSDTHLHLS